MDSCPECGQTLDDETVCQACGTELAGDTERTVKSGVNRRDFLAYSGGSALATGAGISAGWYAFVYKERGPEEEVVREYVDALDRSHFYTAGTLFHEDAPGEPWGANEIPGINRVTLSVEKTKVTDRETEPEVASVTEFALVRAKIRMDDGVESKLLDVGIVVAQNNDGEWKIWRDR
ncbi:hypothetical protein ACFQJ7_16815 [Halovenus rubra]|uniref:Uncharacterized protein n=2 Tax=Halovenus rubra TaxID=869890 RepID=A0ACC7DVK3_9EURY|nr:hypothetical protein [Halovenus rubra]